MLVLDAIYLLILLLATPWLVCRRIRHGKHRRGWGQKLFGLVPPSAHGQRPLIWLHAVSVGELNLLPPLMRELESQLAAVGFRITTSTESGYDHAVRLFGEERVSFFPADFSWAVRRALRRIQPDLLVLMELELWPNLLSECRRRRVPVALVNARMSDRSFGRLVRVPWLARRLLAAVGLIATQSELYFRRFTRLGVSRERLVVTGNLKFDGANTDRNAPAVRALEKAVGLAPGEQVFVAGSTQPGEDLMVLNVWQALRDRHPGLRLVVVPRHPHTADAFCEELGARGLRFVRRSRGECLSIAKVAGAPPEVVVVDVIGELPAWWGLATVGFVGGSFGSRGGQSMIEPAALGVPVCFGPHTWNFRDVVSLVVEAGIARQVASESEILDFVNDRLAALANGADRSSWPRAKELLPGVWGSAEKTAGRLIAILGWPEPAGTRKKAG